jgi:hypothetical protein
MMDAQLVAEALAGRRLQESVNYAVGFLKEEDSHRFWIGCSNFTTNRAFMLAIEAARLLAGLDDNKTRTCVIHLLQMAIEEIKSAKVAS